MLLALALLPGLASPGPPARAQEPAPPRLEPLPASGADDEAAEDVSFRAAGHDPGAPRDLVLWLWDGERFRRLAGARSRAATGRFDFGQLPRPSRAVAYHVAPRGVPPDPGELVWIEPRIPAPIVLGDPRESGALQLAPALQAGAIRIRDAESGRLLERRVLDPAAAARSVGVPLEGLTGRAAALLVDQVLDDGRRSRSVFVRLAP